MFWTWSPIFGVLWFKIPPLTFCFGNTDSNSHFPTSEIQKFTALNAFHTISAMEYPFHGILPWIFSKILTWLDAVHFLKPPITLGLICILNSFTQYTCAEFTNLQYVISTHKINHGIPITSFSSDVGHACVQTITSVHTDPFSSFLRYLIQLYTIRQEHSNFPQLTCMRWINHGISSSWLLF